MNLSIIQIAVISRICILIIQFLSNILIPDHDAGVFQSPQSSAPKKTGDWIIQLVFGGLRRWDAEYFLHIAEYGYTYENTLAFYPLFPLFVGGVTNLLLRVITFISFRELALLVAVVLNFWFFIRSAITLNNLSNVVLKNQWKSRVAVILFCFNPASIFFTAPYTESLYSWLSFSSMEMVLKNSVTCSIPLGLSVLCRSNGLINLGYLFYFNLKRTLNRTSILRNSLIFAASVFIVFFQFGIFQTYIYNLFCIKKDFRFAGHIIKYAIKENLVLAGNKTDLSSPWCLNRVPMAYSYIQSHYWDVGFFKYFELKQIPNFLLAFPMISFMLFKSLQFVKNNFKNCLKLGFVKGDFSIFPFVLHGLFLTIFCFFFVHIQVTTRMIASSTPVFYWFCSDFFGKQKSKGKTNFKNKILLFIYSLGPKDFYIQRLIILLWFLIYFVIGTVLFSNFLPWT